jgi:hypothetical protein
MNRVDANTVGQYELGSPNGEARRRSRLGGKGGGKAMMVNRIRRFQLFRPSLHEPCQMSINRTFS